MNRKRGMRIFKTAAMTMALVIAMSLSGCISVDILTRSGSKESRTEEQTDQNDTPVNPPVIKIEDDALPVITDEVSEPEVVEYEEIFDPVNREYSVKTADPEKITMAFVGDVGFAQGYATINKYRSNGSDIHNSMDEGVLTTMQSVDIMMANNEFPYSDRGTPTPNKTFTFRADPKDVHIMKDMGVDIVSLANNHAYDYGPDALLDTMDTLIEAELPFVGAGKNIDEAMQPVYFHANGKVISIVAATQIERLGSPDTKEATSDSPGVLRTLDPAKAVKVLEEAASHSDFTVMFVHWGTESTDLVEQSQRDLAKAYVDAGADLVIGAHSHCLQGIDYVENVPVFYSLGNFWFNSKTLDTCIVRATIDSDSKLESVEFIPCIQRGSCVVSATESEKTRIIEYMRGISNYAQIDDDGYVSISDSDHNTQNGQNTSPARKPASPEGAAPEGATPEEAAEGGGQLIQLDSQIPEWAVDTGNEQ